MYKHLWESFKELNKIVEENLEWFDDVYAFQGQVCPSSYEDLKLEPEGVTIAPILEQKLELKYLPKMFEVCVFSG